MSNLRKHLSNIFGWRTKRKIVVFESDDWGSIRTRDSDALRRLGERGFDIESSNFAKYDSLERNQDLENLFDVLHSVKDSRQNPAVFTPMTIVGNPDFAKIKESEYSEYFVEPFTETAKRYLGSENIEKAYREGISAGVFRPEYHGREHLNHLRWLRGLRAGEKGLVEPFALESIGFNRLGGEMIRDHLAAYDPEYTSDIPLLEESLRQGGAMFKSIFGFSPSYFVASKSSEPKSFEKALNEIGVKYLTRYKIQKYPLGNGKFHHEFNWLGKRNKFGQTVITRNAGFEPSSDPTIDWVQYCLNDIEIAFKWRKPAVISSHRVNYIGRLSEKSQLNGLHQLSSLLKQIVARWPEVEFMSSVELGDTIIQSN